MVASDRKRPMPSKYVEYYDDYLITQFRLAEEKVSIYLVDYKKRVAWTFQV